MKCRRCGGSGEEPNPVTIGAALRRRREDARITLRAMAAELGYTPAYVSDLELGRRQWRPKLIKAYERALQ